MKDGETLQFSLNDRFGSSPIVIRDSASVPPGHGQGQPTLDQEVADAWSGMVAFLGSAWQTPPQRPSVRDPRGHAAQDQAAWAGSGQLPMVHCPSGSDQVTQDDGSPEAAHQAMIAAMCNMWRKR